MKRYFNMFLITSQVAIAMRGVSLVWFFVSLGSSLLMLIFWNRAAESAGGSILGWTYTNLATYYLLTVMAMNLFVSHIEDTVAHDDIQRGGLVKYLLKPVPYFTIKLIDEIPWRLIQGIITVIAILLFALIAPQLVLFTDSLALFSFAVLIALTAFLISFTLKMCMALMAFWITEINGFMQIFEILLILFGGLIIPLAFLPAALRIPFEILPFSYMIYYPIVALLGKLTAPDMLRVFTIQLLWLFVFASLYRFLLSKGLRKFTAVGN